MYFIHDSVSFVVLPECQKKKKNENMCPSLSVYGIWSVASFCGVHSLSDWCSEQRSSRSWSVLGVVNWCPGDRVFSALTYQSEGPWFDFALGKFFFQGRPSLKRKWIPEVSPRETKAARRGAGVSNSNPVVAQKCESTNAYIHKACKYYVTDALESV